MWPIVSKLRVCLRWWRSGVLQLPKTMGFANTAELLSHFSDHAQDFSALTMSEYEAKADHFMTKPKTNDMHECMRKMGDRQRFDKITYEFGVITSTGVIRTYLYRKNVRWLKLQDVDASDVIGFRPIWTTQFNHATTSKNTYLPLSCMRIQPKHSCVQFHNLSFMRDRVWI